MQTVDKVHRAVDGVDDKNVLGAQIVVPVVLFTEKARVGHDLGNAGDQKLLYAPVVFGHHIAPIGLALGQDIVGLQNEAGGLALGFAQQRKDLVVIHCVCPPKSVF